MINPYHENEQGPQSMKWIQEALVFICPHGNFLLKSTFIELLNKYFVIVEKCSLLEGGNCCSPAVGCFDLHLPEKSFHPVKIQTPGQLR